MGKVVNDGKGSRVFPEQISETERLYNLRLSRVALYTQFQFITIILSSLSFAINNLLLE